MALVLSRAIAGLRATQICFRWHVCQIFGGIELITAVQYRSVLHRRRCRHKEWGSRVKRYQFCTFSSQNSKQWRQITTFTRTDMSAWARWRLQNSAASPTTMWWKPSARWKSLGRKCKGEIFPSRHEPTNCRTDYAGPDAHEQTPVHQAADDRPTPPAGHPALRREWGFAPLCGAAATFSGYSKDPSRPLGGMKSQTWN